MRYLFTYMFLFFILGSVLTETTIPRYKLAHFGLALRKLKLHKEEMRKLQQSTDEDEYVTDNAVPPTTTPYSNSTGDVGQETGDANAADAQIPVETPISTQGTETENKDALIQLMKFHNYKATQRHINFGVFFLFH